MEHIRSILMPMLSNAQEKERMLGALSVAHFFDAHLEVLNAKISPRQFIPNDAVAKRMPQKLLNELETLASRYSTSESSELYELFSKLCAQTHTAESTASILGNPTAHWNEVIGLRSDIVGEIGKVSDLIIIPQPRSGIPTATFEAAIMRSGKPVLLVPRLMTEFRAERIMIAWNGSTEGARAVSSAIPLLRNADEVVIATSKNSENCKPSPSELIDYLAHHGVNATFSVFEKQQGSTGRAILSLAELKRIDLLVMGAFTHRRVHEQIFGGLSRYMVKHAKLPIWMMH